MRVAVEIASRKMILECIDERKEFCKFHGDDFCKEEVRTKPKLYDELIVAACSCFLHYRRFAILTR